MKIQNQHTSILVQLCIKINNKTIKQLINEQQQICRLLFKISMIRKQENLARLKEILHIIRQKIRIETQLKRLKIDRVTKYNYTIRKILTCVFNTGQNTLNQNIPQEFLDKYIGIFNELIIKAQQCQIVPHPDCINCSACFYQGQRVQFSNIKLICLSSFDFCRQDKQLANYFVSILNTGLGVFLIGAQKIKDDKIVIQGVSLSLQQKERIYKSLNNVRKEYIFPQKQDNEILEINFIKVYANFIKEIHTTEQNSMDTKQKIKNKENLYLIKVYINTCKVGKIYFVTSKKQQSEKYEYPLVKFEERAGYVDIYSEQIYCTILKMQENQYYKLPHPSIKCNNQKNENISQYNKKQENQIKTLLDIQVFGQLPVKKYLHESILIVAQSAEKSFIQFLNAIQKRVTYIQYMRIYQKLPKINKRQLFYFTHSNKVQDIDAIAGNIDKSKRGLILLKIKKNIELYRSQQVQQAYIKLANIYHRCYREKFNVLYKDQIYCSTLEMKRRYFFSFSSKDQAIFALCLLEYQGIRSNFVGDGRLDNTFPYPNISIDAYYRQIYSNNSNNDFNNYSYYPYIPMQYKYNNNFPLPYKDEK